MNKTWMGGALVVWAGFVGFVGMARADIASSDVCKRSAADVQALAYTEGARIGFHNQGGLLGDGVCWWHSRLQRAALFLATYRPELDKPTVAEGVRIIDHLADMNEVVVIPGYADFEEFSLDFQGEIQSRLEEWQRTDGFLEFRWVDGLEGHYQVAAPTLQYIMERIHQMVTVEHQIVFEKLGLKGVGSHAYLVIGSRQTATGYEIDVIDSNRPLKTWTIPYTHGDLSLLRPDNHEPFVPYLDYRGDMGKIDATLELYCQPMGG